MIVSYDVIAGVVVFVAVGRAMITVIGRIRKRKNQDVDEQYQAYGPDFEPASLETCLAGLRQIDDQLSTVLAGAKVQDAYKQFGNDPTNWIPLQKICKLDSDFRKITVRMANLLENALAFLSAVHHRFIRSGFSDNESARDLIEDIFLFRDNLEKIASITLHPSGRKNYLEEVQKAFAKIEAIHQSLASAQIAPMAAVDPR